MKVTKTLRLERLHIYSNTNPPVGKVITRKVELDDETGVAIIDPTRKTKRFLSYNSKTQIIQNKKVKYQIL